MNKIVSLLVLTLLVLSSCGQEAVFPSKQITLVVQASPGGLSDQVSRKIGELMSKELDIPVITVYKPGAIGAVGFQFVKNAKNDGYTFGHASIEISMVRKLGYANLGLTDFTALGQAYITIPVVAIGKNSKYRNFNEMVQAAKNNPNSVSIATAGAGSFWHLAAMGVENTTGGAKFNFIPFDGGAPAVAALLGGHVDAVVAGPIEMLANIESGDVVPVLAISSKRSAVLPDTPTSVELGYNFSTTHWGGFIAPANLPKDIANTLQNAFKVAVKSDEYKIFMENLAMEAYYRAPEEFSQFAVTAEEEIGTLLDKVATK